MTLSSIAQSRKALELITKAFKITKNIPIDYRFIVSSLNNLDTEIPLKYRYNGLTFFVVDGSVNDGTTLVGSNKKIDGQINVGPTTGTKTLSGILYTFEEDLTKPIPLHDTVLRFIIRQLTGYNNNWTNLVSDLNHTYAKAGSIVYVQDLGISVIFNGTDWEYFNGIYKINELAAWNTVPAQFKVPNRIVHVGTSDKYTIQIILSNKTLSNEILVVDSIPATPENWRYYLINGYLYYSIGGNVYPLGDKFKVWYNTSLVVGNNNFKHDFNSNLLSGYCRINNKADNQEYNNYEFPIEVVVVDTNTVNIKSSVPVNQCDIVLVSKQ